MLITGELLKKKVLRLLLQNSLSETGIEFHWPGWKLYGPCDSPSHNPLPHNSPPRNSSSHNYPPSPLKTSHACVSYFHECTACLLRTMSRSTLRNKVLCTIDEWDREGDIGNQLRQPNA